MRRRFFLAGSLVAAVATLVGCASNVTTVRGAEKLYLAVEVSEGGRRVAAPRLLGFEGHSVTAERRAPGAAEPEYRLILRPEEQGGGYRVLLDLELPSGHRFGRVGLLHGEERTVFLDQQTELKLMLMRVDSPEFRALMQARPLQKSGSI